MIDFEQQSGSFTKEWRNPLVLIFELFFVGSVLSVILL